MIKALQVDAWAWDAVLIKPVSKVPGNILVGE
jgi:hypothetical protein